MKYFLGVDIGGTMVKAGLFDAAGREMAVVTGQTTLLTPAPGYTERDMVELWDVTAQVIRDALTRSGVNPADVAAVATTGHGKGLYLWGRDGQPARCGIVSTDTRAGQYVSQWLADGTADRVFERSVQRIMVSQPCALLAWLRDHEPVVYANIQWIFEVKDYIRFRLTDEVHGEMTDYSGTNLMNLYTRSYDDELLRLFGLESIKACLPPLTTSMDLCGTITAEAAVRTGLVAGTPVAGGMFDIDACAIASGVIDESMICAIAGTWSINEYLSRAPVTNKSVAMNSIFCMPEFYLIEESSPTSAGNLEWFAKSVLSADTAQAAAAGKSIYAELDRQVAAIAPEDSHVLFLPFVFGAPGNPSAKGTFVGLTSYHTKAHMARAVFEGVVFCHYDHIRKLLLNREKPSCIRLAGGAANSNVWVQLFADVCGIAIETVPVKELGTLGCAINGAVTAGIYPTIAEAVTRMVPTGSRVEPDMAKRDLYQRKFRQYRTLVEALDPVWTELDAF